MLHVEYLIYSAACRIFNLLSSDRDVKNINIIFYRSSLPASGKDLSSSGHTRSLLQFLNLAKDVSNLDALQHKARKLFGQKQFLYLN